MTYVAVIGMPRVDLNSRDATTVRFARKETVPLITSVGEAWQTVPPEFARGVKSFDSIFVREVLVVKQQIVQAEPSSALQIHFLR